MQIYDFVSRVSNLLPSPRLELTVAPPQSCLRVRASAALSVISLHTKALHPPLLPYPSVALQPWLLIISSHPVAADNQHHRACVNAADQNRHSNTSELAVVHDRRKGPLAYPASTFLRRRRRSLDPATLHHKPPLQCRRFIRYALASGCSSLHLVAPRQHITTSASHAQHSRERRAAMASVHEHVAAPQIHKDGPSSLTDPDPDHPISTIESPQDDLPASAKQYLAPIKTRPSTTRRSTEPSPTDLLQQAFNTARPTSSHRNRSPFSRSHLRSRSSGAALSVPITRSTSNPVVNTALRVPDFSGSANLTPTSASPLRSPARQRSPFRQEEPFTTRSPRWLDASNANAIESIREDSELELTPRAHSQGPSASMPMYTVISRSAAPRRRPHSPLHSSTSATSPVLPPTIMEQSAPVPAAGSDSPSEAWLRYNESYPSLHHSASSSSFSSMPSTPTSARSRSPSISSLETIEDAPDLESEAVEAERLARLKLAAERAERAESGEEPDDRSRRGSFDAPRGFGFSSRSANRERKRWSVCGAERRADLDLETIYED